MMTGLDKRWLAAFGEDANKIALLVPISGQAVTHTAIRAEKGISDKQPMVDEYAPLWHVTSDSPPLLMITGDRELEMRGRYEENAFMWRMMKYAGHKDCRIYELDGFNHGTVGRPSFDLLLLLIKERFK